tara:strand:+ start:324 stop:533 length:210 start_codon:yes stop_codon:yes gene_type:complete
VHLDRLALEVGMDWHHLLDLLDLCIETTPRRRYADRTRGRIMNILRLSATMLHAGAIVTSEPKPVLKYL